ncbi:MAG TPA: cytochrome c oxidase assembly protein [Solirubrobacteraceae bacterium]
MTTLAAGFGFAPLQVLPATIAGIAYAMRASRLAGTPRAVPAWRQWCFHLGLLLIVLTLTSPLGGLAEEHFVAHMAEHLLIADVGALLVVLGLTAPVLAPILKIRVFDALRVLAHPLVALPLWALSLLAWHVPVLHEAAVRHEAVHALQHLCFVTFGANMWMPLFGPLPQPEWFGNAWKLGYVVAVRMIGAVLANAFVFGGDAFYDVYEGGDDDQVAAGTVMMVWESLLTIVILGWLFLQTARQNEERQQLLDLAAARGVALTEARATRAVRAGRGAELRARIEQEANDSKSGDRVGSPP